ncbi:uncharacterized protein LOC142894191 isoform X1 [Nelusetta ayraudi]|uniref:uncharacterized protein LOC142894191 isoform X1 n=1 Tax=Nelusetta ayraudi TaxID=303726 RepID=UPI003F6E8423
MEGLYGRFGTKGRTRTMRRSPEGMRRVDGKQRGSLAAGKQTRSSMTTEYQEMFLHPGSHTTAKLQRSARRSANNATLFKVNHMTTKGTQPQPQSSWRDASHHLVPSNQENQVLHQEESVASIYQRDFRGWRALKQQPCKLTDNLKVRQGLVPVGASREGLPVQEPFQSITSYSISRRGPLEPRSTAKPDQKSSAKQQQCAQTSNLFHHHSQQVTRSTTPWKRQSEETSDLRSSSQTHHKLRRAEHERTQRKQTHPQLEDSRQQPDHGKCFSSGRSVYTVTESPMMLCIEILKDFLNVTNDQ